MDNKKKVLEEYFGSRTGKMTLTEIGKYNEPVDAQ